jgi:hypothetical protein
MKLLRKSTTIFCLSSLVIAGCSVKYTDSNGHDDMIGFPPVINEVEEASNHEGTLVWRRFQRTGVGLNLCKGSIGLSIGYEHSLQLWVSGEGAWILFYSEDEELVIKDLSGRSSLPVDTYSTR